ncbi:MAG: hypothetical protein QW510_01910 [Candidatus Bathyarchaeia archaeon]
MDLHVNTRGISTITLILLMVISAVIGGIISYAFTIAYYAKIPEETTLAITDVYINPKNVREFNITVLNPSYSPKNANITRIAISLKNGNQLYDVVETKPSIKKGLEIRIGEAVNITCQTIKKDNTNISFGEFVNTFAGEKILIHVFAEGSPAANIETTLPNVKINITADFDTQFLESVEYFNITIENKQPEPLMNLTVSKVLVRGELVETEPTLPLILTPNQRETLVCRKNWEDLKGVIVEIIVKTEEGYEATYITDELPGAGIYISEVKFDYDDASYINVTVGSFEDSTRAVYINRIELKLEGEQPIPLNTSYPTNINIIPVSLLPNQSVTFRCIWNWYFHRNKTVTLTVYTKQGIKAQSDPIKTPSEILWEISGANFDLDYLNSFTVNVTNKLCSQNITITNVKLNNQTVSVINPPSVVLPGQQVTLNCSFSWSNLINASVTVSVTVASEGGLQSTNSMTVQIPPVKLSILNENFVFGEFALSNSTVTVPYINVTICNSKNSLLSVTITKITLTVIYEDGATSRKETIEINGALTYPSLLPNGYSLSINETITFICFSNWSLYLTPNAKSITVVIYTSESFQASRTWHRL